MSEAIRTISEAIGEDSSINTTNSQELIIRPCQPVNDQISFRWQRGASLIELIYGTDHGLRFVISDETGLRIAPTFLQYTPLPWMEAYARGNAIRLPSDVEPFGTVDEIAGRVKTFLHRHFDAETLFESVATLYVLQTWVYERFHAVPYLRFLGLSGVGKTRATETIGALCYRSLAIAGAATSAPMFRMIEAVGGTLLLDEADYQNSQIGSDIAKILNCGYQKGLPVTRMEKNLNGNFVPTMFSVFGPKIINGRQRFQDDATESRCLPYLPRGTNRKDIPLQLPEEFEGEAREIRNRLLRWRMEYLDRLEVRSLEALDVSPRMNQITAPLMHIAQLLGDPTYREDLIEFARGVDMKATEDRRDSIEAALVEAYLEMMGTKAPTCGELVDRVLGKEQFRNESWLQPRKASVILKGMGFETNHVRRGAEVTIDNDRLRNLCIRFSIVTTVTEPSPA